MGHLPCCSSAQRVPGNLGSTTLTAANEPFEHQMGSEARQLLTAQIFGVFYVTGPNSP